MAKNKNVWIYLFIPGILQIGKSFNIYYQQHWGYKYLSATNITDHQNIAEILFKVALNTITLVEPSSLPVDRKY